MAVEDQKCGFEVRLQQAADRKARIPEKKSSHQTLVGQGRPNNTAV